MKLLNIENTTTEHLSVVEIVENDINFLHELQSWLEDKDVGYSEEIEKLCTRYEIIAGAYFTKIKNKKNVSDKEVEKWKRENL